MWNYFVPINAAFCKCNLSKQHCNPHVYFKLILRFYFHWSGSFFAATTIKVLSVFENLWQQLYTVIYIKDRTESFSAPELDVLELNKLVPH
jgi:hypothetical protein